MSIYIKGMEMPKRCDDCEFHQSGYPDWCDLSIRARDLGRTDVRPAWCPLVEVPPHGRLIDADALCKDRVSNDNVVICAKCSPTIIPAEEE